MLAACLSSCSGGDETAATRERRVRWSATDTPPTVPVTDPSSNDPLWSAWVDARVIRGDPALRVITGVDLGPVYGGDVVAATDPTDVSDGASTRSAAIVADDVVIVSGGISEMVANPGIPMFGSTNGGRGLVSGLPRETVSVRVFSETGASEVPVDIDPVDGTRFIALVGPGIHGIQALDADGRVLAVVRGD